MPGAIYLQNASNALDNFYTSAVDLALPDGDFVWVVDILRLPDTESFPFFAQSQVDNSKNSITFLGNSSSEFGFELKNLDSSENIFPATPGDNDSPAYPDNVWKTYIFYRLGTSMGVYCGTSGETDHANDFSFSEVVAGISAYTVAPLVFGINQGGSPAPSNIHLVPPRFYTGTVNTQMLEDIVEFGTSGASLTGLTAVHAYADLAETGNAPATISDTVGSNDLTKTELAPGQLTLVAGPVFQSADATGSGVLQATSNITGDGETVAEVPGWIASSQFTTSTGIARVNESNVPFEVRTTQAGASIQSETVTFPANAQPTIDLTASGLAVGANFDIYFYHSDGQTTVLPGQTVVDIS